MINGSPHDFIDTMYSGQEIFFLYAEKRYMCQGYVDQGICHMEIQQHIPWTTDCFWHTQGRTWESCLQEFEKAAIFNGKTFWEAEKDITWLDD